KKMLTYIAKNDVDKLQCFVFLSDKMAENIEQTICQAFDLTLERYAKKKARSFEDQNQIILLLRKRVSELEEYNKQLEAKMGRCNCEQNNNKNDFDPRANEKKNVQKNGLIKSEESTKKTSTQNLEELLHRLDFQMKEATNDQFQLERGDIGDAGKDWPENQEEEENDEHYSQLAGPSPKA
uniref:PID domain-containing protein n=1 Tax=Meloidogyne javanica TaxID=6303 RepID=A0A915N3J0_MELJA